MLDTLNISGLRIMARIGIHAWEQKILQPLLIDLNIPMDFSTCNNELTNTIDYAKVCAEITTFVETNTFELIETVAEQIAQLAKKSFNIKSISVSVSKPLAVANAKNICVTVQR